MFPYYHGALWLSGERLPNSHHLLMRFTGGADDLHALALDGVSCGEHKHTNSS